MADNTLTDADRTALRDVLLMWRETGVENPTLPLDIDLDGDGIADAWGLDANDEVVLISGTTIADTVYVSDGDDIPAAT